MWEIRSAEAFGSSREWRCTVDMDKASLTLSPSSFPPVATTMFVYTDRGRQQKHIWQCIKDVKWLDFWELCQVLQTILL